MIKQFAVHNIYELNDCLFDPKEYSRFKCGSLSISKKYGREMANSFFTKIVKEQFNKETEFVIFPSAYCYIKNAAYYMSRFFIEYLNYLLQENGYNIAHSSKLMRHRLYLEEYGTLNKEQRLERLSKDKFSIDTNFTKNKVLLFLDDIFITGAHQTKITQIYNDNPEFTPKEIWFVYYAMLCNEDIPANIESIFNFAEITNIHGIQNLMDTDPLGVRYIVRTIRYILEADEKSFFDFVNKKATAELEEIYFSALCEGYRNFPKYSQNMERLKNLLNL